MSEFPYIRDSGRCDLCGQLVGDRRLRRVVLRGGSRTAGKKRVRLARVLYVCPKHQVQEVRRP